MRPRNARRKENSREFSGTGDKVSAQPYCRQSQVRRIDQLGRGSVYKVIRGQEETGTALIVGIPKARPFEIKFYPKDGGPEQRKNLDPVLYCLSPDSKGFWAQMYWLKSLI